MNANERRACDGLLDDMSITEEVLRIRQLCEQLNRELKQALTLAEFHKEASEKGFRHDSN